MGRDDTYPLPDNRIRAPFRDMTTAEAEHHADTMWPYYASRVNNAIAQSINEYMANSADDVLLRGIGEIMSINTRTPEGMSRVRLALRILAVFCDVGDMLKKVCLKCLLPWTLAALAGAAGILFKDSVPALKDLVGILKSSGLQ